MYHTEVRLEEVVYVSIFYIISFSWFLSLKGLKFTFLWRDSKTIYRKRCGTNRERRIMTGESDANLLKTRICTMHIDYGLIMMSEIRADESYLHTVKSAVNFAHIVVNFAQIILPGYFNNFNLTFHISDT